jgi:2-Cys peroxiredoxin 5
MRALKCRTIPDINLASLERGEIQIVSAKSTFARGRSVIVGIPGAFTPICTRKHVPDFIANAQALRKAGYSQLVCIVPNDPFVLAEWARQLDPDEQIRFLSDGNLEFARALGLQTANRDLFMTARSERYMLIVDAGNIVSHRVEPEMMVYSCTRPGSLLNEVAV